MTIELINKNHFECDRCGNETEVEIEGINTKLPEGWVEFEVAKIYAVADSDEIQAIETIHLCDNCSSAFGFFIDGTGISLIEAKKFSDALVEIAELSGHSEPDEMGNSYVDEWTAANAFDKARTIAKKALGREVTK